MHSLRLIPQKWANHLIMVRRYSTPEKLLNLGRTLGSYAFGVEHLRCFPPLLKVEASNECHNGCKYCYQAKTGAHFSYEHFTSLVDALAPYLFEVSLHDIGEPLLHERILDFIRYAHSRRIGTVISTSLSVERGEGFWRELVESGLDRLIVAIDGLKPETYNRYRTNANLELVMRNLRATLSARVETRSPLRVTWQMINLPWNECEQAQARRFAAELGCDDFSLIQEESIPRKNSYEGQGLKTRTRACLMPYLIFVVTANELVRPCCTIYRGITRSIDEENLVGDLSVDRFETIWNCEAMRLIRRRARIAERPYCARCQEM